MLIILLHLINKYTKYYEKIIIRFWQKIKELFILKPLIMNQAHKLTFFRNIKDL